MYRIVAQVDDDDDLFQIVGFAPVRVQEGSRSAIVETITRANFGLRVGKFEMNVDEGELRFHAAQILTHGCLDDAVIERMMGTTVAMLDMYLPAILSVIYAFHIRDTVQQTAGLVYAGADAPRFIARVLLVERSAKQIKCDLRHGRAIKMPPTGSAVPGSFLAEGPDFSTIASMAPR